MGRERLEGTYHLASPEKTMFFGAQFASCLQPGDILALRGDLGAGKTTFVQGLLQGLNIQDVVTSPTFTYLQIYQAPIPIYHFDLYRLKDAQDFIRLGFEEFLQCGQIAVIEWPDRIASLIPPSAWLIEWSYGASLQARQAKILRWEERT